MQIEVISDTEIRGRKKTVYWAFDQYINFYAEFSKPFTYELVTDSVMIPGTDNKIPQSKVLLHFATSEGEKVLVKVGISGVDMAGARRNVEVELPDWDFDMVRKEASSDWQRYLSKIDISTKDEDQKRYSIRRYIIRLSLRICLPMLMVVIWVWTYEYTRPLPIVRFIPYFLYGILFGHCIL